MTAPLTVVIAPDSFKGTAGAPEAARAIAEGWLSVRPRDHLHLLPQADGGEGTLEAIAAAVAEAVVRSVGAVTGPDGRSTEGRWLDLPDGGAVVELAQCSGLTLMSELDPLRASTRGLGEVIRAALSHGVTSLTIALGGSASTDGGTGALAALGLVLRDSAGRELPDGGGALLTLDSIDRSGLLAAPARVTLLTDVTAPLLGPTGAARVFAAQKGATPEQIVVLERGLGRFAALFGGTPDAAGMGAAGGAAYGLATAWNGTVRPGAGFISRLTGLDDAAATADIMITGEGRFDEQSLTGKVVGATLAAARKSGAVAGVVAGAITSDPGVWHASLVDLAGSTDAAIRRPLEWLRVAGAVAASALPRLG